MNDHPRSLGYDRLAVRLSQIDDPERLAQEIVATAREAAAPSLAPVSSPEQPSTPAVHAGRRRMRSAAAADIGRSLSARNRRCDDRGRDRHEQRVGLSSSTRSIASRDEGRAVERTLDRRVVDPHDRTVMTAVHGRRRRGLVP
ncbi:hypothetical protein [Lysobacter sp. CA199]|uniref:hypothetical protein n=1 Tax=Lysobacter sp. CA199 TaxID=3455608 RepID=UPI003F8D818D